MSFDVKKTFGYKTVSAVWRAVAYACRNGAFHFGSFLVRTVTDPCGVETFSYDPLDRLQTHIKPTGEQLAHEYDTRGNRKKTTLNFRPSAATPAVVQEWSYDKADRKSVV